MRGACMYVSMYVCMYVYSVLRLEIGLSVFAQFECVCSVCV